MATSINGIKNAIVKSIKKPVFYSLYKLTGIRLQLDVHYSDLSMIGAVFNISSYAARDILPSNNLLPVERTNGITEIKFTALEYRSIDILFPYNEFAITIPVIYKQNEQSKEQHGYYYLYLPVTTEDARWGGVENLGFPKFVAKISFSETDKVRSCILEADGKEIITLKVNKLPTELKSWEFNNFGVRDGKLLKNTFKMHGQGGISTAVGGVTFSLGNHPIAEKLQALDIGQTSIQYEYVPKAQAVLSKSIGSPLPL